MTHFNHEWDTTQTPAIPMSVGDRYYAQDLNDDFNYLKHLPYEVFLQGRSRGVMIAPTDIWDNDTNSLILEGGFGVTLQDCVELDPNEDFAIPPKTHSSPRYERIPFVTTTLVLPNDGSIHYIIATPTKQSLLQRTKSIFAGQYASRIRYDGIITIQDTAPTSNQILVGLCHDNEYLLLIDNDINQCKDSIILKKWYGKNYIHAYDPYYDTQYGTGVISALQSYYNTTINMFTTNITVDNFNANQRNVKINLTHSNINISNMNPSASSFGGVWWHYCNISIGDINGTNGSTAIAVNNMCDHCNISINSATGNVTNIFSGVFEYNTINIGDITIGDITGECVFNGTFKYNKIRITKVNNNNTIIGKGTFEYNYIYCSSVSCSNGFGTGTYKYNQFEFGSVSCSIGLFIGAGQITHNDISVGIMPSGGIINIVSGNDDNTWIAYCYIHIGTIVSGIAINLGRYEHCMIDISTVSSGATGINNNSVVKLYHTRIKCNSISSISSTSGKLNVLNNLVVHAS